LSSVRPSVVALLPSVCVTRGYDSQLPATTLKDHDQEPSILGTTDEGGSATIRGDRPSPTIRMLAKTELFRIPLWGRSLRAAEFIEVDRSNHLKAVQSIEQASRLVRDGVSIYLAPEGTRSRDGRIGKLKKGGFHLALETGAPIVPVAIRGTIDILPRGGRVMRSGQRVRVQIGPPIEVAGRDLAGLMAQVMDFLVKNVENGAGIPA